ncbi:hypothetical protein BDF19DRAFT_132019 [Syncephalis fuscata]|nr:hypothetical protein BDF19DRAFT_132019 [Syncephalis fuscata]
MDWCPYSTIEDWQYLAVAGISTTDTSPRPIGLSEATPVRGQIQLWQIPVNDSAVDSGDAYPVLNAVIVHEWGAVWDIAWCPSSSPVMPATRDKHYGRQGVMALCTGDGHLRVIVVPHLEELRLRNKKITKDAPIYFEIGTTLLDVTLVNTCYVTTRWDNNGQLIGGCADGSIVVWDVRTIAQQMINAIGEEGDEEVLETTDVPLIRFTPHDCLIRSMEWRRPVLRDLVACAKEACVSMQNNQSDKYFDFDSLRHRIFTEANPDVYQQLMTIGYDGRVGITDRRFPWQSFCLQRNRAVLISGVWLPGTSIVMYMDPEYAIRHMEIIGTHSYSVMSHNAFVWSMSASDRHPYVASVGADGALQINNPFRDPNKIPRIAQYTPYRIQYDNANKRFIFDDRPCIEVIR